VKTLTPKQERFCREYLVDLNASAAARRAGYSEESAGAIGGQLLAKTHIYERIVELTEKRNARTEITGDMIVRQLERWAFGDTRSLAAWGERGVRLYDSETLTEDEAAMVVEVSEKPGQWGSALKIKRVDPAKALELLMRHKGMLRDADPSEGEAPEPKQIVFTVVDASVPDASA
jgi:phage terminase small subunit